MHPNTSAFREQIIVKMEITEDDWKVVEERLRQDIEWEKEGKIPKVVLGLIGKKG